MKITLKILQVVDVVEKIKHLRTIRAIMARFFFKFFIDFFVIGSEKYSIYMALPFRFIRHGNNRRTPADVFV